MENKDIILFILVIIVLYLLYCDNKKNKEIKELKENFSETSSSVSIPPVDREIKDKIDKYLAERKDIPITESIKNLGILAKRLQEGHFLNVPGDFVIEGDLKVTGSINTDDELYVKKQIKSDGELNIDGNIRTNGNLKVDGRIKTDDGLESRNNIWIEKNKIITWINEDYGGSIGSYIKGRSDGQIDINYTTDKWVNVSRLHYSYVIAF
jgi:hypothetical protein